MSQDIIHLLFAAFLGVVAYGASKLIQICMPKKPHFVIGTKVISLPSEWSDFSVGVIKGFLPNNKKIGASVPIIADVISGETKAFSGVIIPFEAKMLGTLLKLDPFERYSLAIAINAAGPDDYIFSKKKSYPEFAGSDKARSSQELSVILNAHGYL